MWLVPIFFIRSFSYLSHDRHCYWKVFFLPHDPSPYRLPFISLFSFDPSSLLPSSRGISVGSETGLNHFSVPCIRGCWVTFLIYRKIFPNLRTAYRRWSEQVYQSMQNEHKYVFYPPWKCILDETCNAH